MDKSEVGNEFNGKEALDIQATNLDPNATFSDIRASYQQISEDFRKARGGNANVMIRLLAEFLHDPDVRTRWNEVVSDVK